jgi:hypothetical protein
MIKDLRDTFASQLFSAGVQLGYVSHQLGHADVTTTVRHYAKWIEAAEYREPMVLELGEVPADFLARLPRNSPQSPHTEAEVTNDYRGEISIPADSRGSGGWTRTNDLRLMKPPL